MEYSTSRLCDEFADVIDVVDPIFSNYGGKTVFSGSIRTVKCFEDNLTISEVLHQDGTNKVLLIDGGGSLRRALIDLDLARIAQEHHWEGIICYGSIRDVDELENLDIGIQAIASIPVAASNIYTAEMDVPVNFANVTFYNDDYIYADSTGIIMTPEPLDLQEDYDYSDEDNADNT